MSRGLLLAAAVVAIAGTAAGRTASPSRIVFSADRAPTVTGEIYRLDPSGHRIDLSRSPYQDTDPVVSPDGKQVAFLSNRAGGRGVYEVGIDGRGLGRVAPMAATPIAWQPHGDRLAVESYGDIEPDGRAWIVQRHRKPIEVSDNYLFGIQQPWSPDGRVLLVWDLIRVRAVAPDGRTLWTAPADEPTGEWSRQGLLAIAAYHGLAVYTERGRLRFDFALPTEQGEALSWSPDGRYLAVGWNGRTGNELEVRTATGKLVLEKPFPSGTPLSWIGDSAVVGIYPGGCGCSEGLDIRTGAVVTAPGGWLDPLSPNRKLAIVTPTSGNGFSLGVAPPGGGPVTAYAQIGGCFGDGNWMPAVSSLQFVGRSRRLVYQSWNDCDPPFANLYSVAANRSSLERLTSVQAEETQPALSPDGSEIAYVWASRLNTSCQGCSDGIRIATSGGTPLRTLTDPPFCTFDDSPTWSPDGTTLLFSESNCENSSSELYTVPATGGAVHELGIVGTDPAWGPTRIAYHGSGGVWTARPDGSDRIKVGPGGELPAWSPDGRLAYLTGASGTTLVIGSSHVKLPFVDVTSLAWSPDGTRFVVTAREKGAAALDVYTVKKDGTDPVRLTANYDASGVSWR